MCRPRSITQKPLARQLLPLAWGLAIFVGLLVFLVWEALRIQVALAGFMNGESIWSKAQKQAIIDLDTYAANGNPASLASFQRNVAILQYDRFVRDGASSGKATDAELVQALRHGNAIPETVSGVIFMLRHLSMAPYMHSALEYWRSTDDAIDKMVAIADELQRSYQKGAIPAVLSIHQRSRIHDLNQYIEPRSKQFSKQIAHGAVWVGRVLFLVVLGVAAITSLLWLIMARRILAGIRASEERYRLLFDSAADAIVMVDEADDRLIDVNHMACKWIGCSPDDLIGSRFPDLFSPERRTLADSDSISLLHTANGKLLPVEIHSSTALWANRPVRQAVIRDVSEQLAMQQTQRIASEAMANIAEGVIIASAHKQVLSVNAAYTRITGFDIERLRGTELGERRRFPDGSELAQEIWATVASEGNWLGEVINQRADGSHYPELLSVSAIRDSSGRVQQYVAVVTDITESRADRRRLEYLAKHDPLTHLINRVEFVRVCDQAIDNARRDNAVVAVLFIDLDNFKIINDSFSHAIGDHLLKLVADKIRTQLSQFDQCGRIGGDEFTLLASGLNDRDEAAVLAKRLLFALSEPMEVNGHDITLSASIGIAAYPVDGEDTYSLIANADAAMYVAKVEERNTYRYYSPIMQADTRRRLQLVNDMRQALQADEFKLVFQASVQLQGKRVVGVEALLRWKHPNLGEIMPCNFIPLAESVGLIRRIDEWVLNAVCVQVKAWERAGIHDLRVALNVSASWFSHPGFATSVKKILDDYQVNPKLLVIEIIESSVLHFGDNTVRNMHVLHQLGMGVAIDDFGTGYSSLSYLKLPSVAFLKIDRSFVDGLPENLDDVEIVKAILVISNSLGLLAIAEGVETREQHDFLLQIGCREAQGFYYSRPLPPIEIERMLQRATNTPAAKPGLASPE